MGLHQVPHFGQLHGRGLQTARESAAQPIDRVHEDVEVLVHLGTERLVFLADLGQEQWIKVVSGLVLCSILGQEKFAVVWLLLHLGQGNSIVYYRLTLSKGAVMVMMAVLLMARCIINNNHASTMTLARILALLCTGADDEYGGGVRTSTAAARLRPE